METGELATFLSLVIFLSMAGAIILAVIHYSRHKACAVAAPVAETPAALSRPTLRFR